MRTHSTTALDGAKGKGKIVSKLQCYQSSCSGFLAKGILGNPMVVPAAKKPAARAKYADGA